MKVKDFPLGVELKRHYCGVYRIRRTKDGITETHYANTFQEAINWVRNFKNQDKKDREVGKGL